jgi:cathepsin L
LTLKVDEEESHGTFSKPLNPNVDSIDWVAKGAVTHIKDQGQCGSCWTFGTTGVLEGHYFITTGVLPDLAE